MSGSQLALDNSPNISIPNNATENTPTPSTPSSTVPTPLVNLVNVQFSTSTIGDVFSTKESLDQQVDQLCEKQFDSLYEKVNEILLESQKETLDFRERLERNEEESKLLESARITLMNKCELLTTDLTTERNNLMLKNKEFEAFKIEQEMKSFEQTKQHERKMQKLQEEINDQKERVNSLEKKLKKKEDEFHTLEKEVSEHDERRKKLLDDIKKKESSIQELQEELESKNKELEQVTKRLGTANSQILEVKKQLEDFESQVIHLKTELKNLKQENEEYKSNTEFQEKNIARLKNATQDKDQVIDMMEKERTELNNQLLSVKRSNSEKDTLLSEKESDIKRLKQLCQSLEGECEKHKNQLKMQTEKSFEHIDEADRLQMRLKELENQLLQATDENSILQVKQREFSQKVITLEERFSNASTELKQLRIEHDEQLQQLDSTKRESERMKKALDETSQAYQESSDRLLQLKNENSECKTTIGQLEKDKETLESQVYEQKKEIKATVQQLEEKDTELEDKSKTIASLTEVTNQKDEEIVKLMARISELEKSLDDSNKANKDLTLSLDDTIDECEALRQALNEERSFTIDSDPTLKLVLMMKEEGFPIEDDYINRVRGKSIFNLLRTGVKTIYTRDEDSERKNEELFFAEKALGKWLNKVLPNDYDVTLNIYENIADGVILCKMIDACFKEVQPCDNITYDISTVRNKRSDSSKISFYLDLCKKLELKSLFEPDMLFRVTEHMKENSAQDMAGSISKDRSAIISNIAQVFELACKCATNLKKKEETMEKLYQIKLERESISPVLSARSRSSSITGRDRRPKRNSIAYTTSPLLKEAYSPRSAIRAKESMFEFSNTLSPVPNFKNLSLSLSTPKDAGSFSQSSSPHTPHSINTGDDWLEDLIEDMKLSQNSIDSKFCLRNYLNKAGRYFLSEEQREEFMSLLTKFKYRLLDFSALKFVDENEMTEILKKLSENRTVARLDLSSNNLKSLIVELEKFIKSGTTVKYLVLKDCGFTEEEKTVLKRTAFEFDIMTDM